MLTIYTRGELCAYCDQAKALMKQYGVAFTERMIGRDITKEDFVALFPYLRTVPQVFLMTDGEEARHIGGFTDLRAYLEETKGVLQ
jgi:Glutaredoxin and related proteins